MKASGNTIFLPGGTSGIGLALALALTDAGNDVIVAGRSQTTLDRIVSEHPALTAVQLDVTDPVAVARVSADVQERFPDLNVLITMAGVMRPEDLRTAAFLEAAEEVVTTNLLGTIRLVGAFTEFLSHAQDAAILTVSSGLAFTPMPGAPTYSATKAAVHAFTDALRIQLSDSGVAVSEIIPPAVQTAIMPGQDTAEWAMPLDAFVAEVMGLLTGDPAIREVRVGAVEPLRHSEAAGTRDELMADLAGMH